MDNFSAGSHIITTATVFGASALAFSIMPFGIIALRGIMKSKENTSSGFNILGIILTAFLVHTLFCLMYMAIIKILDITYLEEANYFSNKIFRIFWASSKNEVFNLAGVGGGGTIDALGAYATLKLVQSVGKMILINIPFLVVILGASYGVYQGAKDTYKRDYISIISFSAISIICVCIMYVAWAYIASEALFLPDGKNMFDMISEFWQKQLNV